MPNDDPQTATWHLRKVEKPIYRLLLAAQDYDPDRYLSGRKVDAPPAHYVECAEAFARELAVEIADELDVHTAELEQATHSMMGKFARALAEAGLKEEAVALQREHMREYDPHAVAEELLDDE